MGSRYLFVVAFVILVHNSLAMQTTTSTQIQTEVITDYSIIAAFEKMGHLQRQKAIDVIFNSVKDLANVVLVHQNPPDENTFTTNTSKTEVSVALYTHLSVTLLAIQAVDAENYSTISNAQEVGRDFIQILSDRIYSGIDLVLGKNFSEILTEIDALYIETFTAAPDLNAVLYNSFPIRSILPKFKAAVSSSQKKSTVQIRIALKNIFDAIKAIIITSTSRNQAERESIFSVIKSAQNQASLAFKAEVEIDFDLIYNFLTAFVVIQNGIATDFSVIQAVRLAATTNNEKTMNSIFTMTKDSSTTVTPENENEMMATLQALENVAHCAIRNGTLIIFETLDILLSNMDHGHQCGAKDDYSLTRMAKIKEYLVYKIEIDAYFDAILAFQPGASSAVTKARNSSYSSLLKAVIGFKKGIDLMCEKDNVDISAEIERIEELTICDDVALVKDIYVAIINAQESKNETGSAIERAQEKSISIAIEAIRVIFIGIKVFLAQVFPKYRLECEDGSSSLEESRDKVLELFAEFVDSVFVAIRILYAASSKNEMKMEENFCAYEIV